MEFLNVLSRDEMRNIRGGSGDCPQGIPQECSCTYNGCEVTLTQCSSSWSLHSSCDGDIGSGTGQYGGTTCGGQCP